MDKKRELDHKSQPISRDLMEFKKVFDKVKRDKDFKVTIIHTIVVN
jgi:hypothetical protein